MSHSFVLIETLESLKSGSLFRTTDATLINSESSSPHAMDRSTLISAHLVLLGIFQEAEIFTRWIHYKRNRSRRRIWSRPWYLQRAKYSHTLIISEFRHVPESFRTYLRISTANYDKLLKAISPLIRKQDTNFRKAITPHEKLSCTLSYLATGMSLKRLAAHVNIAQPTITSFLRETLKALIQVLKKWKVGKPPSTAAEWYQTAVQFEHLHRFPNAVGAVDGKHVQIVRPPKSGTLFFNYLRYYSVVLMALVGPRGEFMFYSIGSPGSQSDSSIWKRSSFYRMLANDSRFPSSTTLGTEDLPFVILGDSGFAIESSTMTPFRQNQLDSAAKCYFNKRFSSA